MFPRTLTRRIAAPGVATVLVTAALVAGGAPAAQAATSTYTCTFPVLGEVDVPLTALAPELPDTATPGEAVPGGSPVDLVATLPATVVTVLASLGGLVDLDSGDFAFDVPGGSIPVQGLTLGTPTPGDGGALVVPLSGATGAFTAPTEPGSYPVTMPSSFSMIPTLPTGPLPAIPCVTDLAAPLLTLLVGEDPGEPGARGESTTLARAKKSPIRKGNAARIAVRVTAEDHTPTGRVVLKRGKRTVAKGTLNDRGRVLLKTRKLKVGKNRLVAKYKGDEATRRSKDRVVVRVKRRRR